MTAYFSRMDEKWFRDRKRQLGVTDIDIAQRMGRSRSAIPKIASGQQKMSIEWAQAFADVLQVPVSEILQRAGVITASVAKTVIPGMSEGDAAPWIPAPDTREVPSIAEAFGARPGVDVWQIKTAAMALAGYLPGDYMMVDTHQAERVKAGDVVVAQVYTRQGTAKSVLRRWMPPVLVPAAAPTEQEPVYLVDGENVLIRGKVIACWRTS
jgi:SOS-response transcriptional repressor LexA